METIRITRRSIVGFGYNTAIKDTPHGYEIEPTTEPIHTGTTKQVFAKMDDDRNFASFQSGGTLYSYAWFVKTKTGWKEIVDRQYPHLPQLFELDWTGKLPAHIEVEVRS